MVSIQKSPINRKNKSYILIKKLIKKINEIQNKLSLTQLMYHLMYHRIIMKKIKLRENIHKIDYIIRKYIY